MKEQFYAGKIETLKIVHKSKAGFHLSNGQEDTLLPFYEVTTPVNKGDEVEVFFYVNKEGNLVPTMKVPSIYFDKYGWVEVVDRIPHLGVFADIGTAKEVLVSKDDLPLKQSVWPKPGDQVFVKLDTDKKGRLLAVLASEEVILKEATFAEKKLIHTDVTGRVYRSTKVGTFIFTEEGYRGFIHYTERKEEPRLGQLVSGRIIGVKDDGTVNVSLRSEKVTEMDEDSDRIIQYLEEHGGQMPFGDKSDPEEIRDTFHLSKSAFKRALGKLMKEGKIEQKDGTTILK
ncbi:hypothetical protein LGQ02_10865 [Bacillus shivajii]|uniref:CvfB family protein n=1 Tax=Bacillus shivajii TaxID=1983719 RepID=UPI001CF930FF|nr:S1-like domain-containing RNA-binding protein [Bacillus shivajii]UCZ55182.1 hypothetical protein LGQ02_10865 [Bacillus shivajii]